MAIFPITQILAIIITHNHQPIVILKRAHVITTKHPQFNIILFPQFSQGQNHKQPILYCLPGRFSNLTILVFSLYLLVIKRGFPIGSLQSPKKHLTQSNHQSTEVLNTGHAITNHGFNIATQWTITCFTMLWCHPQGLWELQFRYRRWPHLPIQKHTFNLIVFPW